jgi:hypothetical protein
MAAVVEQAVVLQQLLLLVEMVEQGFQQEAAVERQLVALQPTQQAAQVAEDLSAAEAAQHFYPMQSH